MLVDVMEGRIHKRVVNRAINTDAERTQGAEKLIGTCGPI